MIKEQVIAPRSQTRTKASASLRDGRSAQRPARRDRRATKARAGGGRRLRALLRYAPLVSKVILAGLIGILAFVGYRAAASAAFFRLRQLDITGVRRASSDELKSSILHQVAATGVWRTDLNALSAALQRHPWVSKAVVSRVLPDGIRVRITEREPRIVVRTTAGRLLWADDDGMLLTPVNPTDRLPDFFLRGWDESETDSARAENRARTANFLEIMKGWQAAEISGRVSELNLADLRDIRAQLAGNDSQIEVRLGREDFTNRLRYALAELDRQRDTPRGPLIKYIDVSQGVEKGGHLTIGLATTNSPRAAPSSSQQADAPATAARNNNRLRRAQ